MLQADGVFFRESGQLLLEQPGHVGAVGVDHQPGQLEGVGLGLPAQLGLRLAGVADQRVDLGGRSKLSLCLTWSRQSMPACANAASQKSRTLWPTPVAST